MMKPMQQIRGISAVCLLAVPLALSGCGLFGSESASIDAPPPEVEAQMLQTSGGTTLDSGVFGPVTQEDTQTATKGSTKSAQGTASGDRTTVFLEDGNGLLAPVSLSLPKSKDASSALKNSLMALVSKGEYASSVPKGFQGVLPAGTEVSVTVDKSNLAVVEFNSEFNNYDPADERKILEAITWTLTGQDEIKGVQLWVDGKSSQRCRYKELRWIVHYPVQWALTCRSKVHF